MQATGSADVRFNFVREGLVRPLYGVSGCVADRDVGV